MRRDYGEGEGLILTCGEVQGVSANSEGHDGQRTQPPWPGVSPIV
jgi:hypothetical protein